MKANTAKLQGCTSLNKIAMSTGDVEYTDSISADGYDSPNESHGYDTKQSDGEAVVMMELWGIRSIPSLLSLPVPLWSGLVAPDRVLSVV